MSKRKPTTMHERAQAYAAKVIKEKEQPMNLELALAMAWIAGFEAAVNDLQEKDS